MNFVIETEEYVEEEEFEICEKYLQELVNEKAYECSVESIEIIKEYTYEKAIPIGENLTFFDLYVYFFE